MFKSRKIKLIAAVVLIGLAPGFSAVAAENAANNSDTKSSSLLEWGASAGIGYDSNIYRAPSAAYFDYAKGGVLVNPVTKSGIFIPVELQADYSKSLAPEHVFLISDRVQGDLYEGKYSNANNYGNKLSAGDHWAFSTMHNQQHYLYVGGLYEYKKRLYLDRDTGEDQETAAGVDISNRYTYDAYGLESELKGKTNAFQYEANASIQKRNYEDPGVVSQYDHTYYTFGAKSKFKLAKSTKLSVGYDYYIYDYLERPSRSENGKLLVSNPPRKYVYNKLGLTLRQRLSNAWLVYLDYEYKTRTDKYVGYDNYSKNLFKVRLHYLVNKNNKLKLTYYYWKRDYPNAYAFDNQALNISKSYDATDLKLKWTSNLDEHKAIVVDLDFYNENSTDLRYDYNRYKTAVSFEWKN